MRCAEALVVTEVYPPAVGGSGELLKNIYERLPGVAVTVFCDLAPSPVAAAPEAAARLVRRPMRVQEWGLLHPTGLRHHLHEARQIRSFCRGRRAVVHCARALPEGVGAWLARRTGGARYTCWAHGEDIASARSSREQTWITARVVRGAAALFANSRNTASMIEALGVDARRIAVVYPGVDADRFRPDVQDAAALRRELAADGQFVILTIGRLQRRKGHDLVLQALARDVARRIACRYVIVGDGQERDRLEGLVRELGLAEVVTFQGAVAGDRLPAYYAAADLFVHPNRIDDGDLEGFGIVFLEAAAAGLPVIAGRSGGVPEAVADGLTGLLVSGTDVDELSAAILSRAAAPDRRRMFGKAGRTRVEREFTWDRAAARVLAVHEQVAGEARARQTGSR